MTSQDESMGESSSDPLSQDDDDRSADEDSDESSSISSDDSIESDLESESFTDVTPLHSISNSPLPTQVSSDSVDVEPRECSSGMHRRV